MEAKLAALADEVQYYETLATQRRSTCIFLAQLVADDRKVHSKAITAVQNLCLDLEARCSASNIGTVLNEDLFKARDVALVELDHFIERSARSMQQQGVALPKSSFSATEPAGVGVLDKTDIDASVESLDRSQVGARQMARERQAWAIERARFESRVNVLENEVAKAQDQVQSLKGHVEGRTRDLTTSVVDSYGSFGMSSQSAIASKCVSNSGSGPAPQQEEQEQPIFDRQDFNGQDATQLRKILELQRLQFMQQKQAIEEQAELEVRDAQAEMDSVRNQLARVSSTSNATNQHNSTYPSSVSPRHQIVYGNGHISVVGRSSEFNGNKSVFSGTGGTSSSVNDRRSGVAGSENRGHTPSVRVHRSGSIDVTVADGLDFPANEAEFSSESIYSNGRGKLVSSASVSNEEAAASSRRVKELEAMVAQARTRNSSLQRQVEGALRDRDTALNELEQLQISKSFDAEGLVTERSQRDALRQVVEKLQREQRVLERQRDEVVAELRDLSTERDRAVGQRDEIKVKYSQAMGDVEKIRRDYEELQRQLSVLEDEASRVQRENMEAVQHLYDERRSNSTTVQNLELLKQQHKQILADLESAETKRDNLIGRMDQTLEEKRSAFALRDEATRKAQDASNELMAAHAAQARATKLAKDLETQLNLAESQAGMNQQRVRELQEDLQRADERAEIEADAHASAIQECEVAQRQTRALENEVRSLIRVRDLALKQRDMALEDSGSGGSVIHRMPARGYTSPSASTCASVSRRSDEPVPVSTSHRLRSFSNDTLAGSDVNFAVQPNSIHSRDRNDDINRPSFSEHHNNQEGNNVISTKEFLSANSNNNNNNNNPHELLSKDLERVNKRLETENESLRQEQQGAQSEWAAARDNLRSQLQAASERVDECKRMETEATRRAQELNGQVKQLESDVATLRQSNRQVQELADGEFTRGERLMEKASQAHAKVNQLVNSLRIDMQNSLQSTYQTREHLTSVLNLLYDEADALVKTGGHLHDDHHDKSHIEQNTTTHAGGEISTVVSSAIMSRGRGLSTSELASPRHAQYRSARHSFGSLTWSGTPKSAVFTQQKSSWENGGNHQDTDDSVLVRMGEDLQSMMTNISTLGADIEIVVRSVTRQAQNVTSSIQEMRKVVDSVEKANRDIEFELEGAKKRESKLHTSLSNKEDELRVLEIEHRDVQTLLANLRNKENDGKDELRLMKAAVDRSESERQTMVEENRLHQRTIDTYASELARYAEQFADWKQQVKVAEKRRQEVVEKLEGERQERDEMRTHVSQRERAEGGKISKLESLIASIRSELRERSREADALREQLGEREASHLARVLEFERERDILRADLLNLRGVLCVCQEEKERAESELKRIVVARETLQGEVEGLKGRAMRVDGLEEECARLQRDLTKTERQMDIQQSTIREGKVSRSAHEATERQLLDAERERNDAILANERLEQRMSRLSARLSDESTSRLNSPSSRSQREELQHLHQVKSDLEERLSSERQLVQQLKREMARVSTRPLLSPSSSRFVGEATPRNDVSSSWWGNDSNAGENVEVVAHELEGVYASLAELQRQLGAANEENEVLRAQTSTTRPSTAPGMTRQLSDPRAVSDWNANSELDESNTDPRNNRNNRTFGRHGDYDTPGERELMSVHVNRTGRVTIAPNAEEEVSEVDSVGGGGGQRVRRQRQQRRQSLRQDGESGESVSVASSKTSGGSRLHYYYDLDGRRRQYES